MRALILLLFCVACEGPVGPVGPVGPAGEAGAPAPTLDASPPDAAPLDAQGLDAALLDGSAPDAAPDAGSDATPCPPWQPPPGLGGAAHAQLDEATAARWLDWRDAREQARMYEALDPARAHARYRIEQASIDRGCVSTPALIDLGRALFMRRWTLAEGFGNNLAGVPDTLAGPNPPPNMRRFQRGHFGGPDANSCLDCHWKGGFIGAGDRSDASLLYGDGERIETHDLRNPPALWGAGWAQRVGAEMSAELSAQAADALGQARQTQAAVTVDLQAKGTHFGRLTAQPDGRLDTTEVQGIDPDLVVRPFGWKGIFATLRPFVAHSAQIHFTLQAEALVAAPGGLELGGPAPDPDRDGVTREITEGMLTAWVVFLATLDAPTLQVPTEGAFLEDPFARALPEVIDTDAFALRWLDGAAQFEQLGCARCHTPFMPVHDPVFRTQPTLGGAPVRVDLSREAARPHPTRDADTGAWLVPVFSDFKRHDMGPELAATHLEAGVPRAQYLTRRLWGLAQTAPYLHDGSATTLDGAIARHGGEAAFAAEAFLHASEHERASLRVFLLSLRRAPSIRVR
jgi:hypothetical protein